MIQLPILLKDILPDLSEISLNDYSIWSKLVRREIPSSQTFQLSELKNFTSYLSNGPLKVTLAT